MLIIPVFFLRDIYSSIGQDPEVAAFAVKYVWYVAPGVYFFMHTMSAVGVANSMKYTSAGMIITGTASAIHILLIYVLVTVLDWGFDGVAIATSIHLFSRFVVSQIYLSTISELWVFEDISFFSKETFENLGYQFRLGMMSMLMGIWGWWAFDIFTLICSYLAVEVISA